MHMAKGIIAIPQRHKCVYLSGVSNSSTMEITPTKFLWYIMEFNSMNVLMSLFHSLSEICDQHSMIDWNGRLRALYVFVSFFHWALFLFYVMSLR